jgi:hypothetical protein
MNRIALATFVLAAAGAGSAFAESPTVLKDDFVSTRSRAEVVAELHAYKKAGVNPWSISYNPLHHFKGTASRADVTAAYIADRDEVAAFTGEDSGAHYLAHGAAQRDTSATLARAR